MGSLRRVFFSGAKRYLNDISRTNRAAIARDVNALVENNAEGVRTKQLCGPIRELIVGHHRLTYFKLDDALYFVRGFRKKSAKTPRREIEYAEEVYRAISSRFID